MSDSTDVFERLYQKQQTKMSELTALISGTVESDQSGLVFFFFSSFFFFFPFFAPFFFFFFSEVGFRCRSIFLFNLVYKGFCCPFCYLPRFVLTVTCDVCVVYRRFLNPHDYVVCTRYHWEA